MVAYPFPSAATEALVDCSTERLRRLSPISTPKADTSLEVDGSFTLKRNNATGGFGGTRWSRVEALNVDINLRTFVLHKAEDVFGDEPFLWTAFIKSDGDSIDFNDLDSSYISVVSISGSHGNITGQMGQSVSEGKRLSIPEHVGRFSTVLKTIRGLPSGDDLTRKLTNIGFAIVAFDQDQTPDDAIEKGRNAFRETLQNELTKARKTHSAPTEEKLTKAFKDAVIDAIKEATPIWPPWEWMDYDDSIGHSFGNYSFKQLHEARGTIPINIDIKKESENVPPLVIAHYQIIGELTVQK